ncbi:hypothetical protein BGZ57DRAFT_946075 [Hyaloscypha finlandica]|nr:hypothetical protein BGZ57DRAFT_946075 [Hyaloscypha finlandica]
MAKENLNNVLVTGSLSFIGYHIVSKIYHDVGICDKPSVLAAIKQIQPQVIFHAACTYSLSLPAETHIKINLHGTFNVLEATHSVGTVKALVFHSSTPVIEDGSSPVINATEELPVLLAPEQKFPYPLSKALAEQAVLSANRKHGMATVSLRPASCFGEANEEIIEKLIGVARSGRGNIQIGDRTNLYDFVYAGNVADAHLLAAKALLRDVNQPPAEEQRVGGEVFHLTNDEPWLFWYSTREVAKQAGYEVRMLIAFLAEWIVWIVSRGKKEPGLTRYGVRYSCFTRTVSCEKANKRLGYRLAIGMQSGIERSVKWFLESKKDY